MKKENPSFEEIIRMRIVFSVPGMESVNVQRNLEYKTADGQPMHMDLYTPPEPLRPCPAVLLIHGGPIPRTGAVSLQHK
jgi:dipeptidyl aminopeptidase/acylaminoacyl peptidase